MKLEVFGIMKYVEENNGRRGGKISKITKAYYEKETSKKAISNNNSIGNKSLDNKNWQNKKALYC